MKKGAILLIDGEYLKKAWNYYVSSKVKQNENLKLDFKNLVKKIIEAIDEEIAILRTYYYAAPPFDDGTEKYKKLKSNFDKFIKSLEMINFFEVKLGRTQKISNGDKMIFTQKGVDVQLAIDLIKWGLNDKVSVLILITGDSDFIPAINYVKDQGKHVYVLTSEDSKTYNENLIHRCDSHIIMNKDFFSNIEL